MNNKPIAWRTVVDGKTYITDENDFVLRMWQHNGWEAEPLYTHPAKELLAKDIFDVHQSQD